MRRASEAQALLRRVEKSLLNADTARCMQGVVLVAQHMAQNQLGSTLVPGNQAHGYAAEVLRKPPSHVVNQTITAPPASSTDMLHNEATNVPATPAQPPITMELPKQQPASVTETLTEKADNESRRKLMREATVPSGSLSRVFGFGSLAVGLLGGAVNESFRRAIGTSHPNADGSQGSQGSGSSNTAPEERQSAWMNQSNAVRLAASLSRMRGAALKLGQMLSIQDNAMVPPVLRDALARVRDGADYMPAAQLEQVLREDLGEDWRVKHFESFDDVPIAAASLGQVHRATLLDGSPVAVKVQYPGVATSIQSDVRNLRFLANTTGIFPRGMFIERILDTMQAELKMECDYKREAANQQRMRELLKPLSNEFYVPQVYPHLSSDRVLVMEYVSGQPIDDVQFLPASVRDDVGRRLLKLTLLELFEFRFMQADPNFSNFLYDKRTNRIVLLDFGACTEFSESFVDDYVELVWAASNMDRSTLYDASMRLNMLNGDESEEMVQAHIEAGLAVGAPFVRDGPYDFAKSGVPKQTAKHGKTFLKDRLVPPPKEVYPLHRKLSGSYMTCIRMGSTFRCRDLLKDTYERHQRRKAARSP